MSDNNELVVDFLAESAENLDRLDQDFVALEKENDAGATERLASIFRTIHTIKGTCGFLGFNKLQAVAHAGESLLSKLRDGKLAVTSDIITGLLKMVDAVRAILASIETTTQEGDGDYTDVIALMTQLTEAGAAAAAGSEEAHDVPAKAVEATSEVVATPQPQPPSPVVLTVAPPAVEHPKPPAADAKKAEHAAEHAAGAVTGIRVDVGLLDRLMNLVGELVLARNQILQFSTTNESVALSGPSQRLNLITTELQESVMKTRMQPIDTVWSKVPRVVRDLSQMCGKRVRVEMDGKSTELDRTILEAIKDPLTHVIRNSVDHGIESPDKRTAAGKPAEGRLMLRAFHEGGQVNIEIADDGGGVNVTRVKAKAVEKGLITAEQAARMNDREAVNLIFLPGFSTAEKITNVSGRGVGMDVVKTNIEKIGGTVDVQSKPGEGTTLRIKIPLTLAIIPALIITSGGERFAIPQVSLLELVRLDESQLAAVEHIGGTPVYRLRGNLLPLVNLNQQLRPGDPNATDDGAVNIVVLQAEERQFGLVVDHINDTEEIVVKPLGMLFKGLTTFAGATIMGDGRVALILDVTGLAQRANVIGRGKDRVSRVHSGPEVTSDDRQMLLLLQAAGRRRMALPLSQVARLEEFGRDAIEACGDGRVVQYRGRILPLVSLSDWLGSSAPDSGESTDAAPVQAIVYSRGEQSVGLIVDRILDIVQEAVVLQPTGTRPGILGSAVINKHVTEMLDVEGVLGQLLPDWAADRSVRLAA